MKENLLPIFPQAAVSGDVAVDDIKDDASLVHAIERLFEICAANDAVANHHAYFGATGPEFIAALQPKVFVIFGVGPADPQDRFLGYVEHKVMGQEMCSPRR